MTFEDKHYSYGRLGFRNNIKVENIFANDNPFLVARVACRIDGNNSCVVTGAGFGFEKSIVVKKALGELIERMSAYLLAGYYKNYIVGSSGGLRKRYKVLKPSGLRHWHPDQNIPVKYDFDPDKIDLSYCQGVEETTKESILVPAISAFLNWVPPIKEPVFYKPTATGLAAGITVNQAKLNALFEVIERDTCMRVWRDNKTYAQAVDYQPSNEQLRCLGNMDLVCQFFIVIEKLLPPTAIVVLSKERKKEISFGSACGFDLDYIFQKALCEALALQWTVRKYGSNKLLTKYPKNSFEHVNNAFHSPDIYLDRWHDKTKYLGSLPLVEVPQLNNIFENVEVFYKCKVIYVDLSTLESRKSGWEVVRCIIENAVPRESDHSLAHLAEFTLTNQLPHPFG